MSWAAYVLAALLVGANAWLVFAPDAHSAGGKWRRSLGGTFGLAGMLVILLSDGLPDNFAYAAVTAFIALGFAICAVHAVIDLRKAREAHR